MPKQQFNRMLWHYVHGAGSKPPAPGCSAAGSVAGVAEADTLINPRSLIDLVGACPDRSRR